MSTQKIKKTYKQEQYVLTHDLQSKKKKHTTFLFL